MPNTILDRILIKNCYALLKQNIVECLPEFEGYALYYLTTYEEVPKRAYSESLIFLCENVKEKYIENLRRVLDSGQPMLRLEAAIKHPDVALPRLKSATTLMPDGLYAIAYYSVTGMQAPEDACEKILKYFTAQMDYAISRVGDKLNARLRRE